MHLHLHLEVSSETHVSRERNPDDEWDADDTDTSWTVYGVTIKETDGPHALPAGDIKAGDTVYVTYAVYSTGDTFHRDNGEYLEVLSFNQIRDFAEQNRNSAASKGDLIVKFDNGNTIHRHRPWDGYFESLDYVNVQAFKVT